MKAKILAVNCLRSSVTFMQPVLASMILIYMIGEIMQVTKLSVYQLRLSPLQNCKLRCSVKRMAIRLLVTPPSRGNNSDGVHSYNITGDCAMLLWQQPSLSPACWQFRYLNLIYHNYQYHGH